MDLIKPSIKEDFDVDLKNDIKNIINLSKTMGETEFNNLLFDYIDQKGLKDAEVYKAASMDRRKFSKIRNGDCFVNRKEIISLAVALHLTLEETNKLLMTKHYILYANNYFDLIIIYCLSHNIYDFYKINQLLYTLDVELLTKYDDI